MPPGLEKLVTTTQQMLDERYGRVRRRGARRTFWAIVIAVAVAGFGYIAWHTVAGAMTNVSADDLGYEVVDEQTVSVSFQFTAPAGRDVSCIAEAQDDEHGIVGWKVFEFPSSDQRTQRHTVEVPTTGHATTGLVNSCRVI